MKTQRGYRAIGKATPEERGAEAAALTGHVLTHADETRSVCHCAIATEHGEISGPEEESVLALMATLPADLAAAVSAGEWEMTAWMIDGASVEVVLRIMTDHQPEEGAIGVINWEGAELIRFSLMPTESGEGWTEFYAEDAEVQS